MEDIEVGNSFVRTGPRACTKKDAGGQRPDAGCQMPDKCTLASDI